jgi:hypothetical protein
MPNAPGPLYNPYAPPAAPEAPGIDASEPGARAPSRYDVERRNVMLLILLSLVTLGVYPAIWYVRRAPFLDSLDARKRVGKLPWVSLVLTGALITSTLAGVPEEIVSVVQLASGLFGLFLAFRVADILRSDFARTGRLIGISGVGVFFFGCLYLQHVMNEAADTPGRRLVQRGPVDREVP